MKVEIINYENNEYGYVEGYTVKINGEVKFDFWNSYDCPEDNNMSRSFSDVKNIPEVMKTVFEYGKEHPDEQIEFVNYFTDSAEVSEALIRGEEVTENVSIR